MSDVGYKLVLLLRSSDALAPGEFAPAWAEQERHSPTSAAGLLRSVLDAPIPLAAPVATAATSPFDAAVETWWDKKNSAADWVTSREFRERWMPGRRGLLGAAPMAVGGIPQVIWAADEDAGDETVKVVTLPVSSRRLRLQDFAERWTVDHARLALSGPGFTQRVRRIEYTPAPLRPPPIFAIGRYDGVGAITFASIDALRAEFESDYYRTTLAPDETRFADPTASAAFVTVEVPQD